MLEKGIAKYRSLPIQTRAAFWFLICSFMQRGISTITTPIFTHLLSTAEYGRYQVFNSWLGIVSIFVSMNLFSGVYAQGVVKFDKERPVFSSSLQGLTLTLASAWTVIYVVFHSFWNSLFDLTTVQMLAMLLMTWTSAVFNFWATEQRVTFSYKKLVAITILVSIAKPAVGIFFVINAEDKVTARILGLALVELIAYFALFVVQIRRGKKFFHAGFWRYAILFNLPLIPHYLSQTVLNSADRIMIKDMIGEAESGIYSLAYSISMIMTLFNTALSQTISPWIYQKIKDKRIGDISQIAYATLALIAVVNILLIAFAPEVVSIFAPESYYDAIWIMPPVAMSVYFMFAYDLFAKFEFYFEKTKFIMAASIVAAILNIILNYIFIKIFGYYAAGYTTLFCYIIYTVGHYCFMRRVCRRYLDGQDPYRLKILLPITAVFLLVGFVFLFVYQHMVIRYVMVAVIIVGCVLFRKKIMEVVRLIRAGSKKKA